MPPIALLLFCSTALFVDEPYYNSLLDAFPKRDLQPLYINPKLLKKAPKVLPTPTPHKKKIRTWYC